MQACSAIDGRVIAGVSDEFAAMIGSSLAAASIAHPRLDPLPEAADLLGRFAARRVFADRKARAQRVLVIVAHHDEGSGNDIVDIERGLVAERVRRVGEALAADRGLIQDDRRTACARP